MAIDRHGEDGRLERGNGKDGCHHSCGVLPHLVIELCLIVEVPGEGVGAALPHHFLRQPSVGPWPSIAQARAAQAGSAYAGASHDGSRLEMIGLPRHARVTEHVRLCLIMAPTCDRRCGTPDTRHTT
jgi:hypothetical protein